MVFWTEFEKLVDERIEELKLEKIRIKSEMQKQGNEFAFYQLQYQMDLCDDALRTNIAWREWANRPHGVLQ